MTTGRCGPNDVVWNIHSLQGSHHPPGHLKPSLVNLRLPPLTWSLTSLRCPRKCHVKTPNSPSPQNRTGTFCDSISYGRSPHPHSASQPLILLWTRSLLLNQVYSITAGLSLPQNHLQWTPGGTTVGQLYPGHLRAQYTGAAQCGPLGGVEICSSTLRALI